MYSEGHVLWQIPMPMQSAGASNKCTQQPMGSQCKMQLIWPHACVAMTQKQYSV